MGIYRQVASTFWTDTKVADDFTVEDRYLYLYLITNPHTNLSGCYEVSFRQMSYETGLTAKQIEASIKRMSEELNVIRYSKDTKEVLLLHWYKYNWTASEKFRKPLLSFISAIKEPSFKDYLMDIYNNEDDISFPEYGIDTVSDEGRYPIDTSVSVSVSDSVTVSDSDTVSVPEKRKTQVSIIDESELPDKAKEKLKDWVKYKAEKNERYKEMGLKSMLKQVQKYIATFGTDPVIDRIDTAMASGWKGMNLDSITANQKTRAAPGSADDYLMRVARGEA